MLKRLSIIAFGFGLYFGVGMWIKSYAFVGVGDAIGVWFIFGWVPCLGACAYLAEGK